MPKCMKPRRAMAIFHGLVAGSLVLGLILSAGGVADDFVSPAPRGGRQQTSRTPQRALHDETAGTDLLPADFDVEVARARLNEAIKLEMPEPPPKNAQAVSLEDLQSLALAGFSLATLVASGFVLFNALFGESHGSKDIQSDLAFLMAIRLLMGLRERGRPGAGASPGSSGAGEADGVGGGSCAEALPMSPAGGECSEVVACPFAPSHWRRHAPEPRGRACARPSHERAR
eukprot:CAMPEP_0204522840 /NCGR_PEP_ID=MMETSP0661-20131031/6535_1 /ASSEMBLY_ACC=CAM_ASM_000606 /TAXON_ID=109239 /ORGANISM="Alexandrium margalefi, Strain AMGDE01CS-322" /LENGTH=229 /DNA_ID=CAMNT_0051528525 /DNA_START=77 /DNA_END=763 /DNA_ORIENTATION=+